MQPYAIPVASSGTTLTAHQKKLYVGGHGLDTNAGTTANDAFLTLSAAVTAASALTPSSTNIIGIEVVDADRYTPPVSVPSWVEIHAPLAELNGGITLTDDSSAEFARMIASGTGVTKAAGTGEARFRVGHIDASGMLGVGATGGAGVLNIEADSVEVGNTGNGLFSTGGEIQARVGRFVLSGNSACAVRCNNASGVIRAKVGSVAESGTPTTTVGFNPSNGEIHVEVDTVVADTVWNVSGGDLYIQYSEVTGTRTHTSGTLRETQVGASTRYDYLGLSADSSVVSVADWTDLASTSIWGGAAPAGIVSPTSTTLYGSSTSRERMIGIEGLDDGSTNTYGLMQQYAAGAGAWTVRFSFERLLYLQAQSTFATLGLVALDASGQNMVGVGIYGTFARSAEVNVAQAWEFTSWNASSDANDDPTGTWTQGGIACGAGVSACDVVATLARDGADAWTARIGPYGMIPHYASATGTLKTQAGAGWIGLAVQENSGVTARPWLYIRSQLLSTGATLPWRLTP